jgi:hypothetical protein
MLAHVPYGADFVPSNIHLFTKMKEDLHTYVCDSTEEVERTVRTWMKKQSMEFLHDILHKRFHHWRKCVENDGDYVEK